MTAALKFLLDEAQMLPPADITVTGLKKKKKKVRTKTKSRVVKKYRGSQNYGRWISGCTSCVIIFPAGPLTGAEMDFVFFFMGFFLGIPTV